MKRISLTLTIVFLTQALAFCKAQDIKKVYTVINRDGTCTCEISRNRAGNDTTAAPAFRKFASVREMSEHTTFQINDMSLKSTTTLERKFCWFYTEYTFTQTFDGLGEHFFISLDSIGDRDMISYWFTGHPNIVYGLTGAEAAEKISNIEPLINKWITGNIMEIFFSSITKHYDSICNPPLTKEAFLRTRDSLETHILDNRQDILALNLKTVFSDFYHSEAYAILFDRENPCAQEIEKKLSNCLAIMSFNIPYNVRMPGTIYGGIDIRIMADGTALFYIKGEQLIPGDYTLSVTSRATNVWAVVASLLIILIPFVCMWRRRRTKHLGKRAFLLSVFLLAALDSFSQNHTFTLKGKIFEAYTKVELPDSHIEILSAIDSTIIASTLATQKYRNGNDTFYTSEFSLNVPRQEMDYIVRVTKKGYETYCLRVSLKNLYKREFSRTIPNIYLEKQKVVNMDEVTVTATKVKFYLNGDTIIYNADAFQISDGSMLDALIRQLPGVEMKGERIYVNGRFVESLLLNGKDFFKGNNGVLLNNLPNYMVNKVTVYEKTGNDSEFLGHEVANDTRYVMDVRLKKQYATGISGNVELGGGTADKYLARLFAMRFTNHSRLAAYFNANNMNDDGKPGEHTNWKSPSKVLQGVTAREVGGLDYSVDDKDRKYEIGGNVQFAHSDTDIKSNTYQTMFLSGGDVYNRIRNNEERRNFSFSTNHRLYFEWNNVNLELSPDGRYSHYDNLSNYASAALNQDVPNAEDEILGSQLHATYRPFIINRNIRQDNTRGYEWQTGMTVKSKIKFNRTPDNVTIYARGAYNNSSSEKFEHNRIEYYSKELPSVDFKNRYFNGKPNHGYDINTKVTYTYIIKRGIMLDLSCSFNRSYSDTWSNLYLLDNLEGWGNGTQQKPGALPSYVEYMQTFDPTNSYRSRQAINTPAFEPFLVWKKETNKSIWQGQFAMPVSLQNRTLTYKRNNVDTTFTRCDVLLNVYSSYIDWASKDRKYNIKLQYALSSKSPDMNMYLNIYDTTDPLNITVGNPELKPSLSHQVVTTFIRMFPKKRIMWAVEGVLQPKQNAIAMGYTYDKTTGVRTYRPHNINGCWSGDINMGISGPIDKRKKLNLKLMLGTGYVHNVDLIGTDKSAASSRSVVDTRSLTENIRLNYTLGQSQIGIVSAGTWMRSTSERKDFMTVNAIEMKNGLTAQIRLPWHFSVDTDLMLYSRYGYAYSNMNNFVWNTRLTYSLLKDKLLIQLDGYDILKQLSSVNRVINAQGIVETHTNVISRTVLLHVTYRFTKKGL